LIFGEGLLFFFGDTLRFFSALVFFARATGDALDDLERERFLRGGLRDFLSERRRDLDLSRLFSRFLFLDLLRDLELDRELDRDRDLDRERDLDDELERLRRRLRAILK